MSAFSTVGDVFTDPELTASGNSPLWVLVPWTTRVASALGFSSCPNARMIGVRVDSHGCYTFNNADLALGPRDTTAHFPGFLHLRTNNFPGSASITRSETSPAESLGT